LGIRLGWKKKHNKICLFYERYIFHMVIQKAIDSNVKLWSQVCCCHLNYMPFNMVKEYAEAFGISLRNPIEIYIDNRWAITLEKNPMHHEKSKHVNTRHHFIREHVKNKYVELISCKINDQVADIFTKPLKGEAFIILKLMLGMTSLDWV